MAVRERRLPRTQQPQDGAKLDLSNALTRGLLWSYDYAGRSLGGVAHAVTYRSGYGRRVGSQGIAVEPNVANAGFTFVVPSTTLDEYTLVVVADLPSRASPVGGDAVLVGNASGIGVYEFNAGADLKSFVYYAPDYTGSATAHMIGISVVPASGRLVVVQTYRRGAHLRNYVNGAFINQATPLDYPARWSGGAYGSEIAVGSHRAQTIGVQATWLQAASLDDEEARRVSGDPWQAFEERRIWVPVSAGGGGATESRTVSVSGVGDAAWQATAINAQTIASAGVGAASWQGVAITARQLASDGVAAASWQGGAVVGQTIASAGVAAVAFDGVALAPASLSAAGSAAASWQATSIAAATVASAGQASAAWQSVWVHQQAFSSAGVAAASWVGTDASGGTTIEPRTLASAGVGSATWQASVVAAADLVSDGIGAAAWQAAARVVAAFTSAGSSAFAPESARIDVRTLTAAGVGAAAFDGQDAGTVEARTFSSGGAASVSFAVEGEPERAHGFEIGPATTKPKRRGLVVVDETEEKPARQKITKRDIDRRVFERAREEARAVIAKAAEQHATTQHVKAERFAQVRTALKPLAKAIGDWNWIAVYQRMYQQALDEQIRQELAREDAIAAEAQAAEEADERELMNLIMEWM